jgi:hypothetical protein
LLSITSWTFVPWGSTIARRSSAMKFFEVSGQSAAFAEDYAGSRSAGLELPDQQADDFLFAALCP